MVRKVSDPTDPISASLIQFYYFFGFKPNFKFSFYFLGFIFAIFVTFCTFFVLIFHTQSFVCAILLTLCNSVASRIKMAHSVKQNKKIYPNNKLVGGIYLNADAATPPPLP